MLPLPTGEALRKRAAQLGVVIFQDDPNEPRGVNQIFRAVASDAELQKRVIEAEQHLLTQRMWIITVIASAASLLSAVVAWYAVAFGG